LALATIAWSLLPDDAYQILASSIFHSEFQEWRTNDEKVHPKYTAPKMGHTYTHVKPFMFSGLSKKIGVVEAAGVELNSGVDSKQVIEN
jgi:hypothetical protein